jgi:hypothetical protein
MVPWLLAGILCPCTVTTAAAQERRPNLKPYPASAIRVSNENGRSLLRFTSTVGNLGMGPLELYGGATSGDKQQVFQRIFTGTSTYYDREAGWFAWHEAHRHIHFDRFALYLLQPITVTGSGKASEKTTFCVMDSVKVAKLPGMPKKAYYRTCGSQQGMSVGWADVYAYYLAGQYFDITGAPYGKYKILIEADPNNRIVESNDNDNVSEVCVGISSGGATMVSC